jgi:hypothetical protein
MLLHIITQYLRSRNPADGMAPRTVIFGGKAAPGYAMAKLIIRSSTASPRRSTPTPTWTAACGHLPCRLQRQARPAIYPAADLSEQISTAGKEASGTGNMKFMMNGALTIGTLDGANVEIREQVGDDNFFLFGRTTEEVQIRGLSPSHRRRAAGAQPECHRAAAASRRPGTAGAAPAAWPHPAASGRDRVRLLRPYVSVRFMDQVKAVVPLALYLALFQILILRQLVDDSWLITGGLFAVIVGLMLFMEGLKLGLMPFGELIGHTLPRKSPLPLVLLITLLLGIGVTFAEPAIGALKAAGQNVSPERAPYLWVLLNQWTDVLVLVIGASVGLAAVLGTLRFLYGWSLKPLIYASLVPVLGLTLYGAAIRSSPRSWGSPGMPGR